MQRVPFLLLALVLVATATATQADKRQRPTFMATTTYEICHISTAFACNRISATGQRYGTAHEMKHCQRYIFHPDGTFIERGHVSATEGTYRIFAGKVRITTSDQTFELALSPDHTKLGDMKRLP